MHELLTAPNYIRILDKSHDEIMFKKIVGFVFFLPVLMIAQNQGFDPDKRVLIDSIHSKRLCEVYPGLSRAMSTKEAYDEAQYVFTGKVIEIITVEKTLHYPPMKDPDGNVHVEDPLEVIQYFYVLKVDRQFKGETQKHIKVFARAFSSVHPMLMMHKAYLIYAVAPDPPFFVNPGEEQFLPYIYCNGNSSHLMYAEDEIKTLEELSKL